MRRGAVVVVALLLLVALLGAPGTAARSRDEPPQLRRDGRWLVDEHGRVVLTHGVNLVWKHHPFVPPDAPAGFTDDDAAWLATHGFTSVRVGTLWAGVSPDAPGEIDHDYLDAWDRVVQVLAEHRIWTMFDFHQDMLGPIYQGVGVPEWAVLPGPTTDLLGPPTFGFPFNYFTPQVSEAFDNLWAARGPVWDGYRDAWVAVARRWRDQPYSMGYDLLNEPWAGLEWPTCIFPPQLGCPGSDADEIQPFFEHAIAGIRTVDPDNLVWLEPQLLAGGTGSPTGFQPIEGEEQLGYSIHNYCPLSAFAQSAELDLPGPFGVQGTCEDFERDVIDQARTTSERIGAVELFTEFGATDDLELLGRVTDLFDEALVGWQYWAFKEWSDPTTQSQESGTQGLFEDDGDRSTLKLDKARVLVRTYPQATAGTPGELSFDPESGDFRYVYTAADRGVPTEIFVSPLHYDGCWSTDVSGGEVTSPRDAPVVAIAAAEGAAVTVTITAAAGCEVTATTDDEADGSRAAPMVTEVAPAPVPRGGPRLPVTGGGPLALAVALIAIGGALTYRRVG